MAFFVMFGTPVNLVGPGPGLAELVGEACLPPPPCLGVLSEEIGCIQGGMTADFGVLSILPNSLI